MSPGEFPVPGELGTLLGSVVESRGEFVAIFSHLNEVVFLNEYGRRLVEAGAMLAVRRASFLDFFAEEDRAFVTEVVLGEVARTGGWTGTVRLRNLRTGAPIPAEFEVFALPATESNGVFYAALARDVSARLRSEARSRTLLDAGAALSHTLDYSEALEELAKLVVRRLASYCLIDLVVEAGGHRAIRRMATYHVDRQKRDLVAALVEFVPTQSHAGSPVYAAFTHGKSTLVSSTGDAWLASVSTSPEHEAILKQLAITSWLVVPLVSRGKVLGALSCGLALESGYRGGLALNYDAEDLFIIEELGRRAGAAIENARLYENQRNIAVTLQAASLPASLPRIDHLRLAADYRPGSEEATIGGDWFDAFELTDGRVVLSVGDVLGHGLQAAVSMTKLRQAMQSAAMVEADPSLMLRVADATLLLHDPNGFATAIAAVFDPATHRLTYASAGHPAPLLRYGDGHVEELPAAGILLGVRAGSDRAVRTVDMPANCTMVLFTDGLVEATRDIGIGHERLRAALARLDLDLPNPARTLVDEVLAGEHASDDIAVLVIQIASPLAPEDPAVQTTYEDLVTA